MPEPLETPEDNLGNAVDGCPKAPNGRHYPRVELITGHTMAGPGDQKLCVIDAACTYCGLEGSRAVNPYSFNWD